MDKRERVARAICAEKCAFVGEPPCYSVNGEWPNPTCSEPGCHAEAQAAIAALDCIRQEAREAAAIRGPMFRSVRTPPSAKRREARRAAVTLLGIIDDGEVWRVALNAMFRVLNASDDAEHWTTVSEARSALKAALRAIAEDG